MSSKSNTIDYRNKLAERLTALMRDSGTTQHDLAEYCIISRQAVAKWMTGQATPDVDNLAKIADYFNVSTDYLVGRNDYKTNDKATQELCSTLGLSERSIDFLRKDIPLHYEEWEKSDAVKTFEIAQTALILDILLDDHIDYLTNKDNRKVNNKYSLLTLLYAYLDHTALSGNVDVWSEKKSLPISNVEESITIQQNTAKGAFADNLYSLKDLIVAQDIQQIISFLQTKTLKGIGREASIDHCEKIGGDKE